MQHNAIVPVHGDRRGRRRRAAQAGASHAVRRFKGRDGTQRQQARAVLLPARQRRRATRGARQARHRGRVRRRARPQRGRALRDGRHRREPSAALEDFVTQHKTGWQKEPRQKANRCIRHLIAILIRAVESTAMHSVADSRLTSEEVAEFERSRRQGKALAQLKNGPALLDGIQAARSIVGMRLLEALSRIEIFSAMSVEQLETLRDAMTDAPYAEGQSVFEQNDEGDAFYVITEGLAEVLREDERGGVSLLKLCSEGDFFGERALLTNQVRYATIRCVSRSLSCMCITREGFESALGCPLEELVPDLYDLDLDELVAAVRKVDLFRGLSEEQLGTLVRHMKMRRFKQGEFVFAQGDEGDSFYVITSGEAVALRREGGGRTAAATTATRSGDADDEAPRMKKLASLGAWAAFGERALLRDERRYAGIKAVSPKLKCLRIDRATFEEALGSVRELLVERAHGGGDSD